MTKLSNKERDEIKARIPGVRALLKEMEENMLGTVEDVDANWLKYHMKVHDMKNSDLAKTLELTPSQVSRFMNGEISSMAAKALFYYFKSLSGVGWDCTVHRMG